MPTLQEVKDAAISIAAGLVPNISGKMDKSSNLSDVASPAAARTALALASGAQAVVGTAAGQIPALDGNANAIDGKGKVRAAPVRSVTTNTQALLATDDGKTIVLSTGVPTTFDLANVLSAGDLVTIVNRTGAAVNLTTGTGVVVTLAGTATVASPRVLANNGMATILCDAAGTYLIGGAGLT